MAVAGFLVAASQEWRNALIEVGGSNRLLYFRANASTLDLNQASSPGLEKLLDGQTVRLSELYPDSSDLKAAQRACVALARKQREALEEYGVSVAFLAVGIATWDPEGNAAIAEVQAEELAQDEGQQQDAQGRRPKYTRPSAPVLLRSVELGLRRGAQHSWELKLDDDFQINGVFKHVINADKIRINDDEIIAHDDETSGGVEQMLAAIERQCQDVADFAIDRRFILGGFTYQKQPMVDDITDLDSLAQSDLVAALAGDPYAADRVRAQTGEVTEEQPDYQPVDAEFLVMDADASQSYVVNAVLSGRNLVVQGPPGTGKSQTIANVIATSVAAGKKVLFVAQKHAAVTAVLDRLEAVDLSHLTLNLFASLGSRRYVAEELRAVLDRQKTVGVPNVADLHYSLTSSRERLVSHRNALHKSQHGWGITVAELMQQSYDLPDAAETGLRLPAAVFRQWQPTTLAQLSHYIDELDRLGALSETWRSEPGWSPDALTTNETVSDLNEHLAAILTSALPTAKRELDNAATALDVPKPLNWDELERFLWSLREAEAIRSITPALLSGEFDVQTLDMFLAAVDRKYRKSRQIVQSWSQRRAARRRVIETIGHLTPLNRPPMLSRTRDLLSHWPGAHPPEPAPHQDVLITAVDELSQRIMALSAGLQGIDLRSLPLSQLATVLTPLMAQRNRSSMPRAHELEKSLNDAGCGPLMAELRRQPNRSVSPGEILRWVAVRSLLDSALLADAALAGIWGADLDEATWNFQISDRHHLQANAARIRRLAAEKLKHTLDSFPDQHTVLRTELTRKRNFRAIRRLFQEAPEVMLAAKPVWAMSPLQVSRLLPAEQCFDLIVFDEASQIKPADAIPALLRGRQVVVAGDSRQLPPTEFFSRTLDDSLGENFDELANDEVAEISDQPQDAPARPSTGSLTRDTESILFAMERLLAGQSRRLLWHYRSQDERLIAVSNSHVYDGSLTTFPAANTADALRHVVVPFSEGIKGGTNSPSAEVDRVVQLLREHVADNPRESVGVITFGIAHQRRIELALEAEFATDPRFFEALSRDGIEPYFVKSIERVQGDERDAIILSVGYGKGTDGQLRYFWGPLLQQGGERRLNVAISRAKRRVTLVTSFQSDDVADNANPSAGFALMHRFLRFMGSDGRELTGGADRRAPLNPFEIDVRDRLVAAGLKLDPQVGVGSYKIDFAIRHPDFPGRYVLAVEADGASYHSGHVARERDRLRQELLEKRGWRFHRIWSTDWFNDSNTEVEAVLESYKAALTEDGQDGDTENETTERIQEWTSPIGTRRLQRPSFVPGRPITEYSHNLLVALILYIRSDDVLRSEDDELRGAMSELGFRKQGSRITARIKAAQADATHIAAGQR